LSALRFQVTDLLGHPGLSREVAGECHLRLEVGATQVDDSAMAAARFDSIPEGILVTGMASTIASHQCARCLTTWDGPVTVDFVELFARRSRAEQADEDAYLITGEGWIDLEPLIHDEISLISPAAPLCRPDCAGLCPTCGADLNMGLHTGHGDESSSPFAALKQLFESET
jgi:uncharacterized protein